MNKTDSDNAATLSQVKKQNSTHISLTIEHSKRGKSLKCENVHFEERTKVIFLIFHGSQTSPKSWNWAMFTTVRWQSVNVWELRRLVIMSNGLIRDSRDSLNFMMCPKFQVGKFSIWTLQLWEHTVVIDRVCSLAASSLNMQGLLWKRWHLDGWICPSKTCIYVLALMVPFQMCKLPVPEAVIHLHTIRDAVFHFSLAHF